MSWNEGFNRQGSGKPPGGKSLEEFIQDFFDRPDMLIRVLVIAALVAGILSSYYIVRAEEKGVVTRFGRYLDTSSEGLHFKLPFGIDQVTKVPTKIQHESFGFRTTGGGSLGPGDARQRLFSPVGRTTRSSNSRAFDSESLMLTGDLNVADVEWVVRYRVKNPRQYLFEVADPVKNIRDLSQTTMRQVVGDLSINDILTTGRRSIERQVRDLMQQTIDEIYKMGVSIEEVILQGVAPPVPVQPSFNEVNSALQEQKQEINKAEEAYNKVIPEARGKAERDINESRGYAAAVENRARGDADRFRQILTEYREAPEVTRMRMYLELAEDVMRQVGKLTVIDPKVKGVLPVFGNLSAPSEKRDSLKAQYKFEDGQADSKSDKEERTQR